MISFVGIVLYGWRLTTKGVVFQRNPKSVRGVDGTMMDIIDVVFAYILSLITAIALMMIPDLNHKIVYLVVSTTLIIIISFIRAWTEKKVI